MCVQSGRFLTAFYAVLIISDTCSNFSSCCTDVSGVAVSTINLIDHTCVFFQNTLSLSLDIFDFNVLDDVCHRFIFKRCSNLCNFSDVSRAYGAEIHLTGYFFS